MAPEQAAPPAETPIRRLAHFWLVDAPRRLNRPLPRVTDILVDGAWTAAWAPVAAFAPLAAFAVGLLAPLLWPGIDTVFSESLPFMMLVSMTALLSGPAGLMLWLGYSAGDLVLGTPANTFFRSGNPIFDLLVPLAARAIPLRLARCPGDDHPPCRTAAGLADRGQVAGKPQSPSRGSMQGSTPWSAGCSPLGGRRA